MKTLTNKFSNVSVCRIFKQMQVYIKFLIFKVSVKPNYESNIYKTSLLLVCLNQLY